MRTYKATVAGVAEKILAYLSRNPQAEDTLEGVAQWWLLDQAIVEETTCVQEALDKLAADGLLLVKAGLDGRVHYRLNPRKHNGNRLSKEVLMPFRVRNRYRSLVTFELNTRETVHLAPNEVSRGLEDYEVSANRQLAKLIDGGYLEQLQQQEAAAE